MMMANTISARLCLKLGLMLAAAAGAIGLGMALAGTAFAQGETPQSEVSQTGTPTDTVPEDPLFTKVYAHVNTAGGKVPVFASPEDAVNNATPVRELNGYEWVTLVSTAEISGTQFSQINDNEWIFSDKLVTVRPSRFEGRHFDQPPDRPFAWVLSEVQPALDPAGDANPDAPVYKRYDVVDIYEKALVGTTIWYRIGDRQWVRQQRLGIVTPRQPPPALKPADKWIFVNIYEQTLAAYDGGRLVFATLVSSGLPKWETVRGLYQIQSKNRLQPMYNGAQDPDLGDYYLEEVPFNMFFFGSYALHGAYWHDGFGFKKSRGCVNLSIRDAQWLFTWTNPQPSAYGYAQADGNNPGTWVWVW